MCFLWRERKGFAKMPKKQKYYLKLYVAGENHTSFQSPNLQYVESLSEQWREMTFLLGNTEKLSKLHPDLRANDLNIIMKGFWIKTAGTVLTRLSKKAVVLESTVALLKQKTYENTECPV